MSPLTKLVKLINMLNNNGGTENMLELNLEKPANGLGLNLTKTDPTLKNVLGVLKWDMNNTHSGDFDMDIWAFVMKRQGDDDILFGGSDVIYWDQKSHPTGAVSIPFDSRDGSKEELINVSLDKVPADRDVVAVYVFLHKAAERKQTFGMISNASFSLANADTNNGIVNYKINQFVSETALHIGNFVRRQDGWHFDPEGAAAALAEQDVVNLYYRG